MHMRRDWNALEVVVLKFQALRRPYVDSVVAGAAIKLISS